MNIKPLIILLLISFKLVAQKHPIDLNLSLCESKAINESIDKMVICENIALKKWQLEIDNYYTKTIEIIPSNLKNNFIQNHQKWVVYQKANHKLNKTIYHQLEGSFWKIKATGDLVDFHKNRALILKNYYDTFNLLKE